MEELDLKELFKTIWNSKKVIVFVTIIAVIIAAIYTFKLQKPKYQSSTTLVLTKAESTNDGIDSITSSDVTINQKLVSTYSEIIKSKSVLSQVISNLEIDNLTEENLKSSITVKAVEDTEVIKITVSNQDPENAAKIANEIGKVFSEKISEMYKINNVYTLDVAEPAQNPYNKNHVKYILIAVAVGIIVSCGYIVVRSLFDTTVKTSSEIEKILDTPVIAQIAYCDELVEEGEKGND